MGLPRACKIRVPSPVVSDMTPFAVEVRRAPGGAVVAVAVAAGLVAPLALVAAALARAAAPWLPITGGSALLTLALAAIVAFAAPRLHARLGPRAHIALGLAGLALVPVHLLGAVVAVSEPIVWARWRCGTGDLALAMMAPFVVGGFAFAGVLVAAALVGERERPRLDRAIHGLAWLATLAALVAVGFGAARARRPEPDRWVETRPVIAELAPSTWTGRREAPRPPEPALGTEAATTPERPRATLEDAPLLGRTLHRTCVEKSCTVGWSERPEEHGDAHVSIDEALIVRRDPERGIVLVASASSPKDVRALDEKGARGLGARDLASSLGPPRGWLACAALGVAVALALLGSRVALARGGAPAVVRVAWLRAGHLDFENGERWPAPPGLGGRDGDVVTVLPAGRDAPTYRVQGLAPFSAYLGPPSELEVRRRARATARSAFALAAACLLAAPLLAALRLLTA